jgi:methionyl-tRNA formyltransferase
VKKYKVVYIGNRPLILQALKNLPDIILVQAFIMRNSLIGTKDLEGIEAVFCVPNDNSQVLNFLTNSDYDLCISAGCPYILPIDKLPSDKVFINCHPSALPFGRGIHPINEVILSEHKTAGVTVHYLNAALDSGDIIEQTTFLITEDVDAELLYSVIFSLEKEVFIKALGKLIENNLGYVGMPQIGCSTYFSRNELDLRIDIKNITVNDIARRVKAFSSDNLGLTVKLDDFSIKVFQLSKIENPFILERFSHFSSGSVIPHGGKFLLVRLVDGIIRVDKWIRLEE